jgi:hypothetical protein
MPVKRPFCTKKHPGGVVIQAPDGTPVDLIPEPLSRKARGRMERWAAVALEVLAEEGLEGLRRHHLRRMEDLFIAWCNELEDLGEQPIAVEAVEVLRSTGRLDRALEALEEAHDGALWAKLDARRGPGQGRGEYAVRWRIHRSFAQRDP